MQTGAEIGFRQNYSFTEGVDRSANLTLEVLSGSLGRDVVILLHTLSTDTARSKWHQ